MAAHFCISHPCPLCQPQMAGWPTVFQQAAYKVYVGAEPRIDWPDPTPEMLNGDPLFDAIWETIKRWDINVPGAYGGYCGATGNHVRAIYDAVKSLQGEQ